MELIQTIDGRWYWCVDNVEARFWQSITYETEYEAVMAGFKGKIEWES